MVETAKPTFGRLSVEGPASEAEGGGRYWWCICSCGNRRKVLAGNLKSGRTKSCGCLNQELRKTRPITHGLSKTKVFWCYGNMIARCYNRKNARYENYGKRGIRVCQRWLGDDGFSNFVSDMGVPDRGMTLERDRVDEGYSPENCRWVDKLAQAGNKQNSIRVTIDGRTECLKRWSEIRGLPYKTIHARVKAGWDAVKALSTPIGDRKRRKS